VHQDKRRGVWYIALVYVLVAGLLGTARSAEQTNEKLLGTWQGELSINPSTHLKIQFIVSRNVRGHYSAVLNAPEEANLQNIAVNTVSLTGEQVLFVVDEVNGRYEGTLKDGRMTGKWQQSGASFDLALVPYVKSKVTADVAAHLDGPWNGVLNVPETGQKLAIVINFKADAASANGVTASIDSPDQAAFGIPVDDVSVENGNLTVSVLRPKMGFSGQIQGNQLVGKWIQAGSAPFTFNKGRYQAAGLEVSKAVRDRLNGDWYGEFNNGIGIAFKFKEAPNGKLFASLDSPHEGRRGIPINEITLAADQLAMRIDGIEAKFAGTVAQNAITGKLSAGGRNMEVTLKRGEYRPEVLHVSAELAGRLVGKWEGKTANTNMILRFQVNDRGELLALQDIPNRQLFSLPISDLVLKDGSLSLTVKGIAAEFKGKLTSNEINGDWTMPSLQFPLKLIRTAAVTQ
jgi:hypothetical protein